MRSRVAKLSRARRLRNVARKAASVIATADRERAGSGAKHDENGVGPSETLRTLKITLIAAEDHTPRITEANPTAPPSPIGGDCMSCVSTDLDDGTLRLPTASPIGKEEVQDRVASSSHVQRQPSHDQQPRPTTIQETINILTECERYLQLILNEDFDAIRADLTLVLMQSDSGPEKDAFQERGLLNEDQDEVVEVSTIIAYRRIILTDNTLSNPRKCYLSTQIVCRLRHHFPHTCSLLFTDLFRA